MGWPRSMDPRLSAVRADELSLDGPALLDLMSAVLAKGVPFRFRARGWSMIPFVRDGDVITVAPIRQTAPAVGDIVAFAHPAFGNLIVHRVVGRQEAGYLIQGDSGSQMGRDLVPAEKMLGRVTRVERGGRDVRLGLGPERLLIAWLSRAGRLEALRVWLASRINPLLGR